MAKLKNPLLSLDARGSLSRAISFVRRRGTHLVEWKPVVLDVKSAGQLSWRTMFNLCVDLWHTLSVAEKAAWESAGTARHMTGYAWYMSQCLRPNPGIYLPLAGGIMSGDIDMAKNRLLRLPTPSDSQEAVNKAYADAIVGGYTAGARAYHSAGQNIPNVTYTILAFNSERYDTDTIHDNAVNNSRLTCKTAGKYIIVGNIEWVGNVAGIRLLSIYLNGATTIGFVSLHPGDASTYHLVCASIYDLAVNDFVQLNVYQASGGILKVNSSAQFTPEFMMQRVG